MNRPTEAKTHTKQRHKTMTNLNLITHCGAHKVSREQVVATPAPESTKTHTPIAHATFLRNISDKLDAVGLNISQEVHALSHEGMRYFGMMEVTTEGDSDYSTVLGFRNANDKRFTAGMVIGSGVFVCDNLCFSGEIKFGRKHTPNILMDLPALILEAFQKVGAMRDLQDGRIAAYRETELTDSQVNDLLIQALDANVIASAKIGMVLGEWRTPRHQEFVDAGKTTWRLMNAFTEILKPRAEGNDLFMLPGKTEALHSILDATANFNFGSDLSIGQAA